jgi:hypothetical protein
MRKTVKQSEILLKRSATENEAGGVLVFGLTNLSSKFPRSQQWQQVQETNLPINKPWHLRDHEVFPH